MDRFSRGSAENDVLFEKQIGAGANIINYFCPPGRLVALGGLLRNGRVFTAKFLGRSCADFVATPMERMGALEGGATE